MIFAKSYITDTKGESIFNAVKKYFKDKNISLENIMSVATDGAPAMTRCHRGVDRPFKEEGTKHRIYSLRDSQTAFSCKKSQRALTSVIGIQYLCREQNSEQSSQ